MPSSPTTPTVTTYRPQVGVPNRGTSENDLDQFNRQLRVSPLYQNFMRQRGLPTDGRARLTDKQQSELERAMAIAGFRVPRGMHIDQGGNLNQKSNLGRNVMIGALIAAGAVATLGAAGVLAPAALGGVGATGGGAAAAGGAAAGGTAAATGTGLTAGGLLASGAAPIAYSGLMPAATMVGTGATTAGVAGAAAANAANMVGAWGGGAGMGGGGAATGFASVPGAVGATQAPLGAGSTTAPVVNNVVPRGAGMGLSGSNWVDIGGKATNLAMQYFGGRAANQANDRASQLGADSAAQLLALEREKEARRQYEWDQAQKANERNFGLEQSNRREDLKRADQQRLDDLRRAEQIRLEDARREDALRQEEARRLEEREAQGEPARLAREATYRAYMKKYWDIDVAPSVARTSRNIEAGANIYQPTGIPLTSTIDGGDETSVSGTKTPVTLGGSDEPVSRTLAGSPWRTNLISSSAPEVAVAAPQTIQLEESVNPRTPFAYRRQRMVERDY